MPDSAGLSRQNSGGLNRVGQDHDWAEPAHAKPEREPGDVAVGNSADMFGFGFDEVCGIPCHGSQCLAIEAYGVVSVVRVSPVHKTRKGLYCHYNSFLGGRSLE